MPPGMEEQVAAQLEMGEQMLPGLENLKGTVNVNLNGAEGVDTALDKEAPLLAMLRAAKLEITGNADRSVIRQILLTALNFVPEAQKRIALGPLYLLTSVKLDLSLGSVADAPQQLQDVLKAVNVN